MAAQGQRETKAKAPQFEVVSIKQNMSGEERGLLQISPSGDRVIVRNAPMYRIVGFAFDFRRNDLVEGGPEWTRTERWDIDAKVSDADIAAFHALSFVQQKAMLQQVLIDRCAMRAHVEKKEVPTYALVVAKGGLKMHEVRPDEMPPVVRDAKGNVVQEWDLTQKHGEVRGRAVPMEALMYGLSTASLDRQVVDHTGLKGEYNFDLAWTPEDEAGGADAGLADTTGLSIFTAIQAQLGLRFVAEKDLVDALAIEHIERPTAN
jgi:uncharacterized protein (TIGR03435 family)